MTDARAQVRITFFSRVAFSLSILAFSGSLMNGPFFVDLLIYLLASSFLLAPPDDQFVRGLLRLPGSIAERGLAPGRLRVAAGARLALAATVRVVDGVHRRASDSGADSEPPAASRLTARLVLVLDVTDLADSGLAADVDPAKLARRHPDDCVVAFLREQLC